MGVERPIEELANATLIDEAQQGCDDMLLIPQHQGEFGDRVVARVDINHVYYLQLWSW